MRFVGLIGIAGCLLLGAASVRPSDAADVPEIRIEIPVVLKEARIVFNLDHLVFDGDEPIGLQFLRIMVPRFKENGTKAEIIAVFHGNAGYMLLDDAKYDRVRNWHGGNPYKAQIASLIQQGVQVEECAETMRLKGWGNADLLPDVKVNSGANFRIVQLVQAGFVQLQP